MSANIPNKMPKIIAICGAKRSGKDVLADHLVNNYNYNRLSFATPLKLAVKALFNFDDEQVGIGKDNGNSKKDIIDTNWGITPRSALQFIGTEIMQDKIQELLPNIKKNFFANTLKNYISKFNIDEKIVISDLRFMHEYDMLLNIPNIKVDDIMIIRIIRPSNICVDEVEPHISELEYMNIPYDIILVNNGTIDNFISRFEKIIKI
jgi:hypothetical protein